MTNESQWQMQTAGALFAHFFQPDGSSRDGADWAVQLRQGASTYRVTVRAYLSNDLTKRARKDTRYQGQIVLRYICDLLAEGWTPDQKRDLLIVIQNPIGSVVEQTGKPWWRFW